MLVKLPINIYFDSGWQTIRSFGSKVEIEKFPVNSTPNKALNRMNNFPTMQFVLVQSSQKTIWQWYAMTMVISIHAIACTDVIWRRLRNIWIPQNCYRKISIFYNEWDPIGIWRRASLTMSTDTIKIVIWSVLFDVLKMQRVTFE